MYKVHVCINLFIFFIIFFVCVPDLFFACLLYFSKICVNFITRHSTLSSLNNFKTVIHLF